MRGFASPGADDHVRLFLVPPGADVPADSEGWRAMPSREYTPVAFDAEVGWVDLDMVVHGLGPGSEFASAAPIGSALAVAGPRRSRVLVHHPDSWFLAGDETALPAINRFLESRAPGSPARVILEVSEENVGVPVVSAAGISLTLVTRPRSSLADVLATLTESDRPQGRVFGFVAGESRVVPPARALFARWQIPPSSSVTKGYWRSG